MINRFNLKQNKIEIIGILLIITAVLFVYRGLLDGKVIASNDVGTNDLLYFHAPTLYQYGQHLKGGELLYWIPEIYSGFPVFAEGQCGFLYPVNIALYYFFDFISAMNFFLILHSILFGVGIFYFVRKITLESYPAIPAGIAAALCGSLLIGHTRHLGIYAIISLSPYLLIFIERFLEKKRLLDCFQFGGILGLFLLIGHPQFAFISGFISGLYFILRVIFEKLSKKKITKISLELSYKKILLFVASSLVIALIVGLPQILSTAELFEYNIRNQELGPAFTGFGSLPFNGILTFLTPMYWGNPGNLTFKMQYVFLFWEWYHYVGISIFIFAIIGLFNYRKNRFVQIFFIIGITSYILALGENFPLYRIFSAFPIIRSFRFPNRWLIGTELCILILSGFGAMSVKQFIEYFMNRKIKPNIQKHPASKKQIFTKIHPIKRKEFSHIVFVILSSSVVLIDILLTTGAHVATTNKSNFYSQPGSVKAIKNGDSGARCFSFYSSEYHSYIYSKTGWEGDNSNYRLTTALLPPNLGAYFKVNLIKGYESLVPGYIENVWSSPFKEGLIDRSIQISREKLEFSPGFYRLLKLWNVPYVTSPTPISGMTVVWDSASIYLNKMNGVFPRAWVVNKVLLVPGNSDEQLAELLLDTTINLKTTAIGTTELITLPAGSQSGDARIINSENHSLKISAKTKGMLVISDTWYPRWKARVNGIEVQVYRVNSMMRGIILPKENSTIEMWYDSGHLRSLIALSFLTLFLIPIVSVFYLVKNRKK
ncbi:MAG: hypothetical protein HW421_3510 [Ignavibacteria bacterium]|nr:hypothetical protein [Ignavibacteria bacterium]